MPSHQPATIEKTLGQWIRKRKRLCKFTYEANAVSAEESEGEEDPVDTSVVHEEEQNVFSIPVIVTSRPSDRVVHCDSDGDINITVNCNPEEPVTSEAKSKHVRKIRVRCRFCKIWGHKEINCKYKGDNCKVKDSYNRTVCFLCGLPNHVKKNCVLKK